MISVLSKRAKDQDQDKEQQNDRHDVSPSLSYSDALSSFPLLSSGFQARLVGCGHSQNETFTGTACQIRQGGQCGLDILGLWNTSLYVSALGGQNKNKTN